MNKSKNIYIVTRMIKYENEAKNNQEKIEGLF